MIDAMTNAVVIITGVFAGAGDPTVASWVSSKVCRSAGAPAADSSLYPTAVLSALHSSWKQDWQELTSWEPEWSEGQSGSPSGGRWPDSPEVTTAETSPAGSQALCRSAVQNICMPWSLVSAK